MVMHSMTADRSVLDGKELTKQTRRRVMSFARPYRASIAGFLGTIIASTFLGLLPPLLIREIFDDAILDGDGGYLNILFLFMIAAALGEAVLGLVERYLVQAPVELPHHLIVDAVEVVGTVHRYRRLGTVFLVQNRLEVGHACLPVSAEETRMLGRFGETRQPPCRSGIQSGFQIRHRCESDEGVRR